MKWQPVAGKRIKTERRVTEVAALHLPKSALQAHRFVYQFLPFLVRLADFFNNKVLHLRKAADVGGEERAVLDVRV